MPLGIPDALAKFVSNVMPAIIIAGDVGFGFGSDARARGFLAAFLMTTDAQLRGADVSSLCLAH
ncbi:MAG: hypothetical protein ACPG61_13845 [Paracoccaceae bacterium]